MKLVLNGRLGQEQVQILTEAGVIRKIGNLTRSDIEGARLIDGAGAIFPGFIDIHVHGGGGANAMDASEDAYEQIAYSHARHGTTGLLLTTVTASADRLHAVFRGFQPDRRRGGAQILGFHVEGPFINPHKSGAQLKKYMIEPSLDLLRQWQEASGGWIKLITLAPELNHAREVTQYAREQHIVVSMGHSNATCEQAAAGIEWGAQSVTHLFNAMSAANHREPGLAGTALSDDRLMVELIADRIHVHPSMMKTAIRAKGVDRVMLITDAVAAASLPDGSYDYEDRQIVVRDGIIRLKDGTLAGSNLTLDRAVRNLLLDHLLTEADIPKVTSQNQSRLLGLSLGNIRPGAPANLVVMDDQWEVTHTIVQGQVVYLK